MNKHIELVKKWLADKDSVSQDELKANAKATFKAADAIAARAAQAAAAGAAEAAAAAANTAARAAARAALWVKRYEELTGEK